MIKNWKKWILTSVLVAFLAISTACMVEDATQSASTDPKESGVPTPVIKQPEDTEKAIEPPPSPKPDEPSSLPDALQPTAMTIDDITLPTPAYFDQSSVMALGDPNAPMVVVEFADYQCPYCAQFSTQTVAKVIQELVDTGEIYWVFMDFPLEQMHPQAHLASQSAYCAGEQDAFWEMHDALFDRQDEWSGKENAAQIFADMAADLELDKDAVAQCLSEERYAEQVSNNLNQGLQAGVRGTPAFFFNGYPTNGVLPFEAFEEILGLVQDGRLEQRIAESIQRAQATPTPVPIVDVPTGDAPGKGDPNAPVTIVEYSEYQCPFCKKYVDETLVQIAENYIETGKVYYVFKDFLLESIHSNARPSSLAAHCAGEQDAYWEMHDLLFEQQQSWSGSKNSNERFTSYAAELDLDEDAYSECLEDQRYNDLIDANQQEGLSFGVRGTPAFFVNGQFISGAQPYSVFEAAIKAALQE